MAIERQHRDEMRTQLIKAVQEIGRFWDAAARDAACDAIRRGNDKEKVVEARISVARADACGDMANKVIEQINRHWPS